VAECGGWTAYKDPASGLVFWHNAETGASQWEPPLETLASTAAAVAVTAAGSSGSSSAAIANSSGAGASGHAGGTEECVRQVSGVLVVLPFVVVVVI
jgi:WW domain